MVGGDAAMHEVCVGLYMPNVVSLYAVVLSSCRINQLKLSCTQLIFLTV